MSPNPDPTVRSLARDLVFFQLKLLVDTLRDFILSPVSIAAALIDLMLSKFQPPRYFHAVLRLGERSEEWIDLWSAGRTSRHGHGANVDSLLTHVEEIVTDPKSGARRARILKRWAERQILQSRRNAQLSGTGGNPGDDEASTESRR
jgi:hypothetical protein